MLRSAAIAHLFPNDPESAAIQAHLGATKLRIVQIDGTPVSSRTHRFAFQVGELMSLADEFLPPLTGYPLETLVNSVLARGVLHPIVIDEHKTIIDGEIRIQAWYQSLMLRNKDRATPRPIPAIVMTGLTEKERRALRVEINLQRRHLSKAEKYRIIRRVMTSGEYNVAEAMQMLAATEYEVTEVKNSLKIIHPDRRSVRGHLVVERQSVPKWQEEEAYGRAAVVLAELAKDDTQSMVAIAKKTGVGYRSVQRIKADAIRHKLLDPTESIVGLDGRTRRPPAQPDKPVPDPLRLSRLLKAAQEFSNSSASHLAMGLEAIGPDRFTGTVVHELVVGVKVLSSGQFTRPVTERGLTRSAVAKVVGALDRLHTEQQVSAETGQTLLAALGLGTVMGGYPLSGEVVKTIQDYRVRVQRTNHAGRRVRQPA